MEDPVKTLFHLGGTMIVDKGFDIRNYLNLLDKNKKYNKINILNSTSQFSKFSNPKSPAKFNYDAYLTTTFNNIPSKNINFKKSGASFSFDLTKKKYFNTESRTNFDFKNNRTNNSNYNFLSTKNTSNLMYGRKTKGKKYCSTESNENFNVFKAIKEIKKNSQIPNITNIKKSPNRKFFITKINNNKIKQKAPLAYSNEYIDIVFDSKKLINKFNFRKGLELDPPEDLLTFSSKKKEISVKNTLSVLLNNESEKLLEKEKDFKIRYEKNKNILDSGIKDFENLTEEHKKVCKNIENCFDKLQKENNNLLNELIVYRSLNKNNVDEIQKVLEQIEHLREYALFVHYSLNKDVTRYSKNIFPDYRNERLDDYNKKIEKIRNFVINNYSIFWDNKYREEVKEELSFLEEPDLMIQKFNEIEVNIMRLLEMKDNLHIEFQEDLKNHKIILDELKARYEDAEKEYTKYENNLKIEMNQINSLKKKEIDYNSEILPLIGSLFFSIVEIFGEKDKQKMNYKSILNSKIDNNNVEICFREGERLLREQEDLLNNTLHSIKLYQEKDGRFFDRVMDETKQKNKMQKHLLYKKNKMDKFFEDEKKFIHKANKLTMISRKTEAPFHFPQKKTKKVVNYALIKRLEDEELLKYD